MNTNSFLSKFEPGTYALLRIVAGFLFLWHGSQLLFNFPPTEYHMTGFLAYLGGSIDLFGGLLVMIGLWTRWAAFFCSGEMAVAYWMFHGTKSLLPIVNGGEMAMIYCFLFLFLSVRGSGIFSVENLFSGNKKS